MVTMIDSLVRIRKGRRKYGIS